MFALNMQTCRLWINSLRE